MSDLHEPSNSSRSLPHTAPLPARVDAVIDAALASRRLVGGALLPRAWVDEMGRNQTGEMGPPDKPGYGFGLGFSVLRDPLAADSPESPGTWRWGGAYGHSWFVDRSRGLSVVALTNTFYEGMSGAFVNALRDAVYGVTAPTVHEASLS